MTRRIQAGRSVIVALLAGAGVVSLSVLGVPPAQAQDGQGTIVGWGYRVFGVDLTEGFVAVAGGSYHSLGLKADGSIVAWGDNAHGQCDVPSPNTDFVAVAGGCLHSLGLKADGSIAAWGWNYYGQCDVPAPNMDFVAVAGGYYHSLGLKADGSIVAWGWNDYGQCDVPTPNTDFVAVAAGYYHSLGLKADGSIVAWGRNDHGQCDVPAPNTDFVAVAAGYYHSLGLKADGSIVGWGWNYYGQCDPPSPNSDFVAIAAGYWYSLGLKADGSIRPWGYNGYGQCDVPAPNTDFVAVAGGYYHSLGLKADGSIAAWGSGECNGPAPNTEFVGVATGGYHILGLRADGSIVAWGDNYYGQCDVPAPNTDFVAVAGSTWHSLGLKGDGSIVAWGRNDYGQCNVPAPNTDFVGVAAGWYHSLGLKADGSIVAWGRNDHGQCNVPAPNTDFLAVAGGMYHSLGLKTDGSIVAWGRNHYGQCDVPAPNTDFVAVAGGGYHSFGLKANASIVAWGANGAGQCNVPAPNTDFVAVAGGLSHSLGLKADGSIMAWGYNNYGQCNVPAPNTDFVALAAGGRQSLGLKGTPATIGNVSASQRPDASKLVDIAYSLSGEGESYTITVKVSDDGGTSWDITPTALSGDVGSGIVPGEDKHILWNPAVDIPGLSGTNFVARVRAGGWYYGDSNVFSIVAAGPGELVGSVSDLSSGDPIEGAEATVPGQDPVQTGEYGEFGFTDVPAGETTLAVTKDGYYPVSEAVIMREDSGTYVDICMTPDIGFAVVEVRGNYCGPGQHVYYLHGVGLNEAFTAMIDWDTHTPDYVRWIISTDPNNPIEEPCSGDTAEHTFNMGSEFGEGGTLSVVAVAADQTESTPYLVCFKVIPAPVAIPVGVLVVNGSGQTLAYDIPEGRCEFTPVNDGVDAGVIPEGIPFFGAAELRFKAAGMLEGSIRADGTVETKLSTPASGMRTMAVGPVKFRPMASGFLVWQYEEASGGWVMVERGFTVGVEGSFGSTFYVWYLPPIYFEASIGVTVEFGVIIIGWVDELDATLNFTAHVAPWLEGELGLGVNDFIEVDGYLRGGCYFDFLSPPGDTPCWGLLEAFGLFLTAGAEGYWLGFQVFDLSQTWTLDLCGGGRSEPFRGWRNLGPRLIDRDYLAEPYAVFVANSHFPGRLRDEATTETPLQLNVFPQSIPDLAAVGNDLLLVWVYDDPVRTPVNRTEVVFSKYDSATEMWSEPVAVADDGTADYRPQITAWYDGDALLAWENVYEVLEEPNDPNDPNQVAEKLEEAKSKTEIVVAKYDAVTGQWQDPNKLTDNAFLDRSPRTATASDGTAMLTWVSNAANHEMGDVENPNDIHYGIYDGTTWSAAADVTTGVPSIVKSALAYKETQAILLFTGDTDGDNDTLEDRELFGVVYADTWGAVTQLTDDSSEPIQDANPQVAYDSNGDPVLVWYRGGDLYAADILTDPAPALSGVHEIVHLGGMSAGAADFRLSIGASGQVALVWQSASEERVDMWYGVYEPALGTWSRPLQLTADGSMERGMAPVYDAAGDLVVAYNKVQIDYEIETIQIGDKEIEVEMPVAGQVDLYVLRHTLSGDLAIDASDIAVDPSNPLPDTDTTITAIIHNVSDVPAENIEVAFYDGDPSEGGTLIDTVQTYAGPLVGSDSGEVSVTWTVAPSTEPRQVFVIVDPNQVQEDRDRTNNTASTTVLAPDLTITEIGVQSAGPDRLLTIRVTNEGVLPVTDVEVKLHKGRATGPVMATLVVPELVPGAYHDLSYPWESPRPHVSGVRTVCAVVDAADAIGEFDEMNNTRSALVPVKRPDVKPVDSPSLPAEAEIKPPPP